MGNNSNKQDDFGKHYDMNQHNRKMAGMRNNYA